MITTKHRILAVLGAALVLGVLCFTGCPQGTGFDGPDSSGTALDLRQSSAGVTDYPDDLDDYVYGGNPTGAAGSWNTFAFNNDGTVIVQEVTLASNTSTSAAYVYDDTTGEVVIGGGYGTFTISDDDGSTMTSQSTPAVVYQNLRPVGTPPSFATTPADLVNTVFAAAGPRTPDWVTFVFRGIDTTTGAGVAIASFTGDNTTNVWVYTEKSKGVFNLDADPGQTDPGEFTLDTANSTIVFTNFFGHAPGWTANRRQ